jgi:lipopolysaccharide biosynthesis protein
MGSPGRAMIRTALLSRQRQAIVDAVGDHLSVEYGSLRNLEHHDRIAVLAHYSAHPMVSRSFRELVGQLSTNGYFPLIVSACDAREALDWGDELPESSIVVRKPNVGYDFGSWAVGLRTKPVSEASRVIIANDSMLGPFSSLRPLVLAFENTSADVWGLTDSRQYTYHLQSYFLGFAGGILTDTPLRAFWRGVRDERTKFDVIRRYELGLSRILATEGYVRAVRYRADDVVQPGENPVIRGWWRLLARGFPFVKREIARDPGVAPRGTLLSGKLYDTFGIRLQDWL